jgi:hypothetical protein
VITARVPSEPASSEGQWRPTVSFGSPASEPTTVPSASTASTPITWWRIVPKRTTREPPALVAIAPPTVAESRAAKSTGVSSPWALAARCQSAIVTPAPAVICIAAVSGSEIASSRRVDSTIVGAGLGSRRVAGTLAPTRPVLPAWVTTATSCSLQWRSTCERPRWCPGRTTAAHGPEYRAVQSVS